MSITLEKMTREVVLVKEAKGLGNQTAEVWAVIDISASIRSYFENGTMQAIIDRAMAVGMGFDANKQIDVVSFGVNSHYEGTVTERNYSGFANDIYRKRNLEGGTQYAEAIKTIRDKTIMAKQGGIAGFFGVKKETKTLDKPVYVLFFTDGDNQDKDETTKLIKELSKYGIFFQFIGVGNASFNYLQKLDDMSGRVLDNVDFFPAKDVVSMDNKVLFEKMINEFAKWVPQARAKGIIN
ncbi:VWA domain-containing protein [Paenibacillus sp. 481]|uniref:VWA domain-containing protein n=1 Tax=Paenibacillus sp. 481 TaxID=2835869 RepID=UPI001E5B1F71|nr:VWA domain-containing protein [Paenibacillus sp. 481]UHA74017.1 VWA domain-containing protein [Paenibacillus sp. 481]